MKKLTYDVIYHYYQYNSGAGDNGYGTGQLHYTTLEDAQKMYRKITSSIDKRKHEDECYKNNDYSESNTEFITEDEEYDLKMDLLPYSGYFMKVSLAKTYRERIFLDENGNEIIGE